MLTPGDSTATQEIRLAVVLNGGVSLAVWISGVTYELNRLVQASRLPRDEARTGSPYAQLLDLLDATARIDVIAGTSAGGLNGGFLALGLVHGADLSTLRTLWEDQGDLGQLLRDPRRRAAPSLLRGDYFYDKLAEAYTGTFQKTGGRPATGDDTVDLYLTGTLWEGRSTQFADDMGRQITEVDYDATFHFTSDPEVVGPAPDEAVVGDLRNRDVVSQLAVASRCTSSFPAAFEPFRVRVHGDQRTDERWQSSAGRANFSSSQFLIDGGVLRNKPIRPAIDAVYRQSADQQVRRLLAYVVPDPGEEAPAAGPPPAAAQEPADGGAVPGAHEVLLGVLTRLRSTDSVSDELAEIRRRNDDTRHRRRTRDRLAGTLLAAADARGIVASAFPGYLDVRRDSAAQSIAGFILAAPSRTRWSRREIATVLRDLLATDHAMPFIPDTDPPANGDRVRDRDRELDEALETALAAPGAEWRWGQTTVGRLGDLVLDVLKRAVWLAGPRSPYYPTIVAQRAAAHATLVQVRTERTALNAYWRGLNLPPRSAAVAASPEEIDRLEAELAAAARRWKGDSDVDPAAMQARLKAQALAFAECLREGAAALRAIAAQRAPTWDPHGADQARFGALVAALLGDAADADGVLRNMLQLEVLHVAFAGASADIEQEVELVQISSAAGDLLTGIQLHHFGAFYRRSWRTNDWLRGRLDGCRQLVEMLLAPERLRQLGYDHDTTLAKIHDIAVGPPGTPNRAEFEAAWVAAEDELAAELRVLSSDEPLPRTFPRCAERIAHRLIVGMLDGELRALVRAIGSEAPDALPESRDWATDAGTTLGPEGGTSTQPTAAALLSLLGTSGTIGRQRIASEMRTGTDTYARTVTHAAAAASSTASSFQRPKQVAAVLSAFRGYTILLWVMVNFLASRSDVGRNAVAAAIGVGGALVALTLLVPAVPIGVTLAGVLLLFAAASVAALRQKPLLGSTAPRWRLVGATVLVLLALGGVVVEQVLDSDRSVAEIVIALLLRVLVVVLIVGFGWFIAWERRPRSPAATSHAGAGTGPPPAPRPPDDDPGSPVVGAAPVDGLPDDHSPARRSGGRPPATERA